MGAPHLHSMAGSTNFSDRRAASEKGQNRQDLVPIRNSEYIRQNRQDLVPIIYTADFQLFSFFFPSSPSY
jgi:hypothetical protein